MKQIPFIIFFFFIIIFSSQSYAEPLKGFHEGPYLRIIGGLISAKFDDHASTGSKTGNDYEGAYGFHFGWNISDSVAPELEVRYSTTKSKNSREHIVNINLNTKYHFITNGLTNLGSLHILPFVQGGIAALVAAVPGDSGNIQAVWGLGVGGGAGIDFLINKYIYFGFIVQGDIHYIPSVKDEVNGRTVNMINSGWEPQLGVIGAAGVHF